MEVGGHSDHKSIMEVWGFAFGLAPSGV